MNKLNYTTWLVPLDIALELKAIGFDEPCHFQFLYYHGWEMLKKRGDEYGFITSNSCRAYVVENHNGIGKLSVPTWEDTLAWFREKGYKITFKDINIGTQCAFYHLDIKEGHTFSYFAKKYEKAREGLVMKLIEVHKEFGNNIKRK
jgi:hypothetical protein